MSRRYKAFNFTDELLLSEGLTKDTMDQMFEQLPEDAKIVRFGHHMDKAMAYFIVESEEFDVVSESEILPEGILKLTKPMDLVKEHECGWECNHLDAVEVYKEHIEEHRKYQQNPVSKELQQNAHQRMLESRVEYFAPKPGTYPTIHKFSNTPINFSLSLNPEDHVSMSYVDNAVSMKEMWGPLIIKELSSELVLPKLIKKSTDEWEQSYLDVNKQVTKFCECGAEKVKSNVHSGWCPRHEIS